MGPLRSHRPRPRRSLRRVVAVTGAALTALLLSGCSQEVTDQWSRLGLPEPAVAEAPLVRDLWVGYWIAALAVGLLVWGLILFASVAYRRRGTGLPPQFRYNMPIEVLYTLAPLIVIVGLFAWNVKVQDELIALDEDPDVTIGVVGQQWSWVFNYVDQGVYDVGTPTQYPTLYLPVDNVVQFDMRAADVNHSFWVPAFYFKMDLIPGRLHSFQMTPDTEGTFAGKCAELCGTYHNRMLYDVKIVSQEEFDEHIAELRERGQTGELDPPLRTRYDDAPINELEGFNTDQ